MEVQRTPCLSKMARHTESPCRGGVSCPPHHCIRTTYCSQLHSGPVISIRLVLNHCCTNKLPLVCGLTLIRALWKFQSNENTCCVIFWLGTTADFACSSFHTPFDVAVSSIS